MDMDFLRMLDNSHFAAAKYKNKRVVLYGMGRFFTAIKKYHDLSVLNIIAVSDIKYENTPEPLYNEEAGYNIIQPEFIHTLNPDVVLVCLYEMFYAVDYFEKVLFKSTGKKFKYESILSVSAAEKINREWMRYF